MSVSIWQATLFGIFACLASLPGMGGTVVGNYTLGRPLVGGLICGLIMGDVATGIIAGAAIQIVYIALITPGGAVAADVRAISYIGVPLSIIAITNIGLTGAKATSMATALGSTVGTLGTVLMYGTATMNLIWQAYGWKCLESGKLKKLYAVDMGLPWISHIICSFIPTFIITYLGSDMIKVIQTYLPMDGVFMMTILTLGSLLPCVGIAILLKQVANRPIDILIFMFGFTLAAVMGCNLVAAAIIGGFTAWIYYQVKANAAKHVAVAADDDFEEEEDI